MSLEDILKNPETLAKMMQAIKSIDLPNEENKEESENSSSQAEMNVDNLSEKLPEIISAVKLLGGSSQNVKKENDRRIGLLLALRPYLSPHRCEVIDYIIKMNNFGEIFKNIM